MTGHGRIHSVVLRYDIEPEPERDVVYHHTHSQNNWLSLPKYARVNFEAFESHSSIIESSTSRSDEGPVSVNMEGISKVLTHQLEAYA